jgi:hypothetical protein
MNQGILDGLFNSSLSDTPGSSNIYRKGKLIGAMVVLMILLALPLGLFYLCGASASFAGCLFSLCIASDYILCILRTAKELKR